MKIKLPWLQLIYSVKKSLVEVAVGIKLPIALLFYEE